MRARSFASAAQCEGSILHRQINDFQNAQIEISQNGFRMKALLEENEILQGKLREYTNKIQLLITENLELQEQLKRKTKKT